MEDGNYRLPRKILCIYKVASLPLEVTLRHWYGQRQNEDDLWQITAAIAQITPEMLRATCRNSSARYEMCRDRRDGHVEC
jgi:hypothetical protein